MAPKCCGRNQADSLEAGTRRQRRSRRSGDRSYTATTLERLWAPTVSLKELLGRLRDRARKVDEFPVGCAFFRRGRQPDLEAVAVQAHHLGALGPGHHRQAQQVSLAGRQKKRGHGAEAAALSRSGGPGQTRWRPGSAAGRRCPAAPAAGRGPDRRRPRAPGSGPTPGPVR